jgi:hypothetical protein
MTSKYEYPIRETDSEIEDDCIQSADNREELPTKFPGEKAKQRGRLHPFCRNNALPSLSISQRETCRHPNRERESETINYPLSQPVDNSTGELPIPTEKGSRDRRRLHPVCRYSNQLSARPASITQPRSCRCRNKKARTEDDRAVSRYSNRYPLCPVYR